MYCLCVNVHCHRVTTQLQLTNIYHIIITIIIISSSASSSSPPSHYTILLHSINSTPYLKLFTLWAGFVHRLLLATIIRVQNTNTTSRLVFGSTLRRTQWEPPFFPVAKAAGAWRLTTNLQLVSRLVHGWSYTSNSPIAWTVTFLKYFLFDAGQSP